MKGTGLYVLGIFGLAAIAVAGMVVAEVLRPGEINTALTGQILGIVTPAIAALILLLKSAANGQAIEEVKQKADTAATAAVTAKTVAAATRQELAANTQLTQAVAEKVAPEAVSEVTLHGPPFKFRSVNQPEG